MTAPIDQRALIGPFAEPRPTMRGRYLLPNKRTARAMAMMDAVLSLMPVRHRSAPAGLQRILVANWGHLGDVVTTLGAIAALRDRYPGVEVGMIVSSWARPAIASAGVVDHLHVVDHWWLNRARLSRADKIRRYRDTRAAALREIAMIGYEAGIDFYPFFPTAHPLFWSAAIPVRVGFTSGGFGPLLTHPAPWPNAERPIADHYRALLNALDPARPVTPEMLRPRRSLATVVPLPPDVAALNTYIVVHPGAGAAFKDWGVGRWQALLTAIAARYPGLPMVVTGAGARELALAETLQRSNSELVTVAVGLEWEVFVGVIARAALVICPDTATGHVAALFDTPVISIFTGTNVTAQWRPYSDRSRVLLQPVRCSPCNRAGCEALACIREVLPSDVMKAIEDLHALEPSWAGT